MGSSGREETGPIRLRMGEPRAERESVIALFRVHMFPIGCLPVAMDRPARQLPEPSPDADYIVGLRFPPADHPDSALVEAEGALSAVLAGRRRPPSPPAGRVPEQVTAGFEPFGTLGEQSWQRRYLGGLRGSVPEYAWPPGELFPEGGEAAGEPVVLAAGALIDRFGLSAGRVFAPDGTPFARRALPAVTEYRRYEVIRELPVWRAVSAAWFGGRGGGTRYRATHSAEELVTLGYLAEITGERE